MGEISDENTVPLVSSCSHLGQLKCLEPPDEERVPFSDIQKAAYLVDQALARHLMPLEVLQHQHYNRARHAYALYNHLFYIRCASLVVLTLLPFFEEPEWCSSNMLNGHCDETSKYLLSGVRYFHPLMSTLIQVMCILPLAVSLMLQHYYKFLTFWEDRSTWIKVGLLVGMGLHLVTSVPQIPWLFLNQSRSMGMYLCILIPIFFSRSLRNCFRMTMRIGHSFVDTAGVLIGFTLISAWLANQLFDNENFEDFPTSLLSLFIMLTSANNPNVWVETYEQNHNSFFFFFTYMVIAFFFLMQLLFALIYNNYKVQLAIEVQNHTTTRTRNLRAAFDLLNLHREGICTEDANTLFFEIGCYRHVHDLGELVEQILVDVKGKEGEKIIFGEFQILCAKFVRAIEAQLHDRPHADQQSNLGFYCSEDLLESAGYMFVSFTATLASVLVAILDHNIRNFNASDTSDSELSKFLPSLETLTMCEFLLGWLFVTDLAFRMHVRGVGDFFHSVLNCFDFIATTGIIGLQISTIWYPNAFEWVSVSIVIRSMRYISLLGYFSRWRFMGRLLICMVPATAPILGFQFLVCSLFSVAGVHLFGGLVFVGNPRLDTTEYASSGLWVFNYNDYGSAMVTSFNLCVVNNWYVIMDGYTAASESNWPRAYFIIFWAIAVTFTLNVVVAFFVGAFTTQMDRAEHAHSLYSLAPGSSKTSVLARRKLGASLFMGYSGAFSKYDLYEEVVKRYSYYIASKGKVTSDGIVVYLRFQHGFRCQEVGTPQLVSVDLENTRRRGENCLPTRTTGRRQPYEQATAFHNFGKLKAVIFLSEIRRIKFICPHNKVQDRRTCANASTTTGDYQRRSKQIYEN